MIKARFVRKQPPVKVVNMDGILYIYICLNGQIKEDEDWGGNEKDKREYIEYDYQELTAKEGEIDLDDLNAHPEKYVTPLEE